MKGQNFSSWKESQQRYYPVQFFFLINFLSIRNLSILKPKKGKKMATNWSSWRSRGQKMQPVCLTIVHWTKWICFRLEKSIRWITIFHVIKGGTTENIFLRFSGSARFRNSRFEIKKFLFLFCRLVGHYIASNQLNLYCTYPDSFLALLLTSCLCPTLSCLFRLSMCVCVYHCCVVGAQRARVDVPSEGGNVVS
jgi:hypothetical protein